MSKLATAFLWGAGLFALSKLFGKSPALSAPPVPGVSPTIPATAPVSPKYNKYRQTRHGANPWTQEGLNNAIRLHRWVDKAEQISGGKLTSGFRSARVQKLVHQARGYSPAPNDPHTKGKAYDIVPVKISLNRMNARLLHASKAGDLGPIKAVQRGKTRDHMHLVWN